MSYSDPMKLFNILREKEQNKGNYGSFGNSYILKLQRGKAYALRLLWLPSNTRDYPMINQYVHHFWNDNAIGSKDVSVICPTSQYDMDGNGFKACPICTKMSEFFKAANEGSTSASELYKKFKRTLRGYVPVYVVNGPEEDKHKIKIMPYTISFKKYFDEKIFGIKSSGKNNDQVQSENVEEVEDNMIGIGAFMYYDPKTDSVITSGHNLLVSVGTKRVPIGTRMVDMPDYKIEFSMKNTEISDFDGEKITPEYFKNLSKEIHFDEDFYKMSDENSLNRFLNTYITGSVDDSEDYVSSNTADKVKTIEEESEPDEEVVKPVKPVKPKKIEKIEDDEDEEFEVVSKPSKKSPSKQLVVEEESEEAVEETTNDDDDLDLDDLLKDIDI